MFDCGGFHEISADYFIDGTGDGALAVMAGAEFELGRESDGECQPMTMAFYLSGIDSGKMPPIEEINRAYRAAKLAGTVKNPRENVLFFATPEPGVYQFNTTRIIRRNPTDPEALSEAQHEGRRQVEEMIRFLRTLPGFQNARLSQLASQIGVRESRRIRCDYRFTLEDMYGARRFPDGIVRSTAHPDIHNPVGEGTWFEPLPAGVEDYEIPFRSLLPEKLENLTIGSRCIGCSHEAFSAVRMIGHVGEYGRAGGELPEDWELYDVNCGRLEWLEYNLRRALGVDCGADEREIGVGEVRATIAHAAYYHRMKSIILDCLLRYSQ